MDGFQPTQKQVTTVFASIKNGFWEQYHVNTVMTGIGANTGRVWADGGVANLENIFLNVILKIIVTKGL